MKIKAVIVAAVMAVVGFSSQPVTALDITKIKPAVPLFEEVLGTARYMEAAGLHELGDGTLVALSYEYVNNWQGVKFYASTSLDDGVTWSTAFELFTAPNNRGSISATPLGDGKLIVLTADANSLNSPLQSRTISFIDGVPAISAPVEVHPNTDAAKRSFMTAGMASVGDTVYAYVTIFSQLNGAAPNELYEYKSTNEGISWTKSATVIAEDENLGLNVAYVTVLSDGERVINMHATHAGTSDRTVAIRVSDSGEWRALGTQDNWYSGEKIGTINGGKGIVAILTAGNHSSAKLGIWSTTDSEPTFFTPSMEGNASYFFIDTDSEATIAFSYHERENDRGYGALQVTTQVSADMGLTWTKTIHESLPDGTPPQEKRFYSGEVSVNSNGEIIRWIKPVTNNNDGYTLNAYYSNDSGVTWSTPYQVIDGAINDFWNQQFIWNENEAPKIYMTRAYDLADFYNSVPVFYTFEYTKPIPAKLGFKAGFKFGALKLGSAKKAALKDWAESIPDGTVVRVTAPNFEKPDAATKKTRSLKRAQQVANILTNAGLEVQLVKGELVKWVDPAKGRLIKVRIVSNLK